MEHDHQFHSARMPDLSENRYVFRPSPPSNMAVYKSSIHPSAQSTAIYIHKPAATQGTVRQHYLPVNQNDNGMPAPRGYRRNADHERYSKQPVTVTTKSSLHHLDNSDTGRDNDGAFKRYTGIYVNRFDKNNVTNDTDNYKIETKSYLRTHKPSTLENSSLGNSRRSVHPANATPNDMKHHTRQVNDYYRPDVKNNDVSRDSRDILKQQVYPIRKDPDKRYVTTEKPLHNNTNGSKRNERHLATTVIDARTDSEARGDERKKTSHVASPSKLRYGDTVKNRSHPLSGYVGVLRPIDMATVYRKNWQTVYNMYDPLTQPSNL